MTGKETAVFTLLAPLTGPYQKPELLKFFTITQDDMLDKNSDLIIFSDDSGKWQAEHPVNGIHGPLKISYKNDILLTDCSGYCGDKNESTAVARKVKDYHKGGLSVVEAEGFMPFEDGQISYKHSYKYSNRRVRVISDISFIGNIPIKRHFGVGSLFLPGKWKEFHVVPAAGLKVHGAEEKLKEIPKYDGKALMLGHWHRPPLSVTFKRPNGTTLEIGTGNDVWRWEENLAFEPESGSFKIILEENGIRFIREPLACCETYLPPNRSFRFSWYIAWRENGANKALANHHDIKVLFDNNGELDLANIKKQLKDKSLYAYANFDLNDLSWDKKQLISKSPYDFIRGINTELPCWATSSVITRAKKIIRKLIEIDELDGIIFKNFTPKVCYQSHHVNKKHENGSAHWDVNGLFDFASWTSNACKDKLELFWEDKNTVQPSLLGLFQ